MRSVTKAEFQLQGRYRSDRHECLVPDVVGALARIITTTSGAGHSACVDLNNNMSKCQRRVGLEFCLRRRKKQDVFFAGPRDGFTPAPQAELQPNALAMCANSEPWQ